MGRFCYHGEVLLSWRCFVVMERFFLSRRGFVIMGRFYHGEILSWGGFVIMEKFHHGEVLLSCGGFIMGRFCYHEEVLLSWGGFLEQYTTCKSLHVIEVLLNSLYIQKFKSPGSSKLKCFLCDARAVLIVTHYDFHSARTLHSLRIINFRKIVGFVLAQL